MKPFVLVQLSDPHIGACWAHADSLDGFRASLATVRKLPERPDAIVVSGDLAEHGSPEEYASVAAELRTFGVPVLVVPGNHDDRASLRRCFELPGDAAAPVSYTADAGSLRLVMLDTTVPRADGGDLEREQLDWLDANLSADARRPVLVVMHHPPLRTGIAALDAVGLSDRSRVALAGVIERHRHVRGILAGHVHRTIASRLGGNVVLTAPSTYVQLAADPEADRLRPADGEATGFLVHRLIAAELVSYLQTVE